MRFLATLSLALLLGSAGAQAGHHRHAAPTCAPHNFTGMASFYGSESGTHTASGQRFVPSGMTAAHRCLPFGTKLRVTHKGRSVVVTVNDRGPFIAGRVLDLAHGAAIAVGLTGVGVGPITAEVQ